VSTRSSIKHEHDEETGRGFHLYTDWLDKCVGAEVVHLRLDGVAFEASSNGTVTVTLRRDMAERLGLLASVVS
jgi:hypothetical protein